MKQETKKRRLICRLGCGFDFGGRFDFMFGTDTPYTHTGLLLSYPRAPHVTLYSGSAAPAYAQGSRGNQLLIGADAVIEF